MDDSIRDALRVLKRHQRNLAGRTRRRKEKSGRGDGGVTDKHTFSFEFFADALGNSLKNVRHYIEKCDRLERLEKKQKAREKEAPKNKLPGRNMLRPRLGR